MNTLEYSLPPIADFLSLPGQRLMGHALRNRLTDSPGLLLHSLLCRIVAYALAKHLPPEKVDIDTLLSLGLVSHSTRIIADEAIKGVHPDPEVNEYMQTHSNIDFAHRDALNEGFSPEIVTGVQHFTGNPRTRIGYFPHETMIKDGEINWTEALYQIASWSIDGGITTLDVRFDDLRARRSEDIGKLELDYIKEQIKEQGECSIPGPILEKASKELGREVTNSEIRDMIASKDTYLDNTKMGEWKLNGYETWAYMVRKKYCEIVGVENFDTFLRKEVDIVLDREMRGKIITAFESVIGRPLRDNEYCATMPGIELVYNLLGSMKVEKTQAKARERVEKLMSRIERVARPFISRQSR